MCAATPTLLDPFSALGPLVGAPHPGFEQRCPTSCATCLCVARLNSSLPSCGVWRASGFGREPLPLSTASVRQPQARLANVRQRYAKGEQRMRGELTVSGPHDPPWSTCMIRPQSRRGQDPAHLNFRASTDTGRCAGCWFLTLGAGAGAGPCGAYWTWCAGRRAGPSPSRRPAHPESLQRIGHAPEGLQRVGHAPEGLQTPGYALDRGGDAPGGVHQPRRVLDRVGDALRCLFTFASVGQRSPPSHKGLPPNHAFEP